MEVVSRTLPLIVNRKIVQILCCNTCICQKRYYNSIKLRHAAQRRIERRQKPFFPTETGSKYIQEWQKHPEVILKYRRKAWARHGATSGVDPGELIPSRKEIEEEVQAEKEWWPTLQEMQENLRIKKEKEENEKAEYERKVAENMAKMPKWIEEWEENQRKERERSERDEEKRQTRIEKAREIFGYNVKETDHKLKEFLKEQVEQERIMRKKAKKLAKKMHRADSAK